MVHLTKFMRKAQPFANFATSIDGLLKTAEAAKLAVG